MNSPGFEHHLCQSRAAPRSAMSTLFARNDVDPDVFLNRRTLHCSECIVSMGRDTADDARISQGGGLPEHTIFRMEEKRHAANAY